MASVKYDTLQKLINSGVDSPFLQARLDYIEVTTLLNQHVKKMVGHARIHPRMCLPQASGRLGISDPPLGNFTADKRYGPKGLRDVVRPDPGTKWICADFKSVEARLITHLDQDPVDLEIYQHEEWDIHSLTLIDILWKTPEARLAHLKDLPQLRGGVLGTALLDQSGERLLQVVRTEEARCQELRPGLSSWETALQAPIDNGSPFGRGSSPQEWRQERQQAGEFGTDVAKGTHKRASGVLAAWASWVLCGGPPPDWRGGSDRRRTLAKNVRYTMQYSKKPEAMAVYASALGMAPQDLVSVGRAYLRAKPWLVRWKEREWAQAWKTREARTVFGRRRRLFGNQHQIEKEGLNHRLQGSVADLMKQTMVALAGIGCRMVLQRHDGWYSEVPQEWDNMETYKAIVEREWIIENKPIRFPIDYEIWEAK